MTRTDHGSIRRGGHKARRFLRVGRSLSSTHGLLAGIFVPAAAIPRHPNLNDRLGHHLLSLFRHFQT